jgi:hypothetical protein
MVATVLPARLPLRPDLPEADTALPLVEIIELKWLLAGLGVHIHVERLQNDPVYARQTLADAAARGPAALRQAARRLLDRLGPAG